MYSLADYGAMVADRVRLDAYAQAVRKTVREGSTLAEIGTGPGIFALLACQVGASKVFAIEPSPVIQVAREVAAANGCADKIEFFEDLSNRVKLPFQVDVLLSDLRGVLPLFERHISAIVDARRRFLAPGGTMIPRKDMLWSAIVEAPKPYDELVDPWDRNPLGHDLSAARQLIVNNPQTVRVIPNQLLTEHQLWATLDYGSIEDSDVQGNLTWRVQRGGTGHGILVWFDTELAEGIEFSNAPSAPETVYGSLFFPWTQPVSLAVGQTVAVSLEAKLMGDNYVWRWTTHVVPLGGASDPLIHFEQSQLAGELLSPVRLHRMAADYVPHLSEEGRLWRRTLELMEGNVSLEEIAHRIAAEFPPRFPRWEQALSYVGAISQDYSR